MRKMPMLIVLFALALASLPPSVESASRCALPKKSGALFILKRNLTFAARSARGADARQVKAFQSKMSALTGRESSFAGKARALEGECKTITALFKKLNPQWEKLKAERKSFKAKMKGITAEWKSIIQESKAIMAESRRLDSVGCYGKGATVAKKKADRCNSLYAPYNQRVSANKARNAPLRRRSKEIKKRMKTLEDAFKKARIPVSARWKKYTANKKAYLAERKGFNGSAKQLYTDVMTLLTRVNQSAAKKRREESVQRAQRARLEAAKKLRGQVKGMQEALRRLSRSMRGDAVERAQWERATNEAMENAWNRGKGMIVDESLGVLGKRLGKQLAGADMRLKSAMKRLSKEKRPIHQKRLKTAIARFKQQKTEIGRAKSLVTDRLKDAKQITDAVDYATSNPGDLEKSLRGTYEIVKTTLGDPKVQKALKIGGKLAAGAGYAQSIVDSSYDIAVEVVSWKRINQLNRNSDAYLKAVGKLKVNMENKMKKIQELEGKKK